MIQVLCMKLFHYNFFLTKGKNKCHGTSPVVNDDEYKLGKRQIVLDHLHQTGIIKQGELTVNHS